MINYQKLRKTKLKYNCKCNKHKLGPITNLNNKPYRISMTNNIQIIKSKLKGQNRKKSKKIKKSKKFMKKEKSNFKKQKMKAKELLNKFEPLMNKK